MDLSLSKSAEAFSTLLVAVTVYAGTASGFLNALFWGSFHVRGFVGGIFLGLCAANPTAVGLTLLTNTKEKARILALGEGSQSPFIKCGQKSFSTDQSFEKNLNELPWRRYETS